MFAEVGNPEASYAFVFNDTERYDKNYQYDIIGKTDYMVSNKDTVWVENIFESTDNELLAAVSTYFRQTTDFELFIYVNDQLQLTKNGTCVPGYTTINLGTYIPLYSGDKFKVRFKLNCEDNNVEFAISEKINANKVTCREGISFFSEDGVEWIDLYDYFKEIPDNYYFSQVAAIKAFTILHEFSPVVELNVSADLNTAYIEAFVHDSDYDVVSSGNLIFNIGGINYTAALNNSHSCWSHVFDEIGSYDVLAFYADACSNVSLKISQLKVDLDANISISNNDVSIDFICSHDLSSSLNVLVNTRSYSVKFNDNKATLSLNNLDFGHYDVYASIIDNAYVGELNSSFNVASLKLNVFTDLNTANIEASVSDPDYDDSNPGNVVFVIGDVKYTARLNDSKAYLSHIFDKLGSHEIRAYYKNVCEVISVNISRMNVSLDVSGAVKGNDVAIDFISPFDLDCILNVKVNSQNYSVRFSKNMATLTLNDLDSGNYDVYASIDDDIYAGDISTSFNVTVSKTMILASDLTVCYNYENYLGV